MRRYLCSGGLGFLGSAFVKRLVAEGNFVRVLDDCSRGSSSRLYDLYGNKNYEEYAGDIRHAKFVATTTEGIDCVLHLAAINGTNNFYRYPDKVLEVGVKGMLNVIDGCVKNGVKELFLVSSSEVYQQPNIFPTPETVPLMVPDPLNPRYSYGSSKIISEMLSLHCGAFERVLIVRPHNIYGPNSGDDHVIPHLIRKCLGFPIDVFYPIAIQGTGQETRSFCYIDDCISGFMKVLEKGEHKGIYNVGTDSEIKIIDLARSVVQHCERRCYVVAMEENTPRGETKRRCPDVTKLKRLGWEPKVSLSEGLAKTVQWFRERVGK